MQTKIMTFVLKSVKTSIRKVLSFADFPEVEKHGQTVIGQIDALFIISLAAASGYILRFTFRSLSDVSYSDECRTKMSFPVC